MSSNKERQHGGSRAGAGRKPTLVGNQTNLNGFFATPTNKGTAAQTVADVKKKRKDQADREEEVARVAKRNEERAEGRRQNARARVERLRVAHDAAVAELEEASKITGPNAGSAASGPSEEGADEEEEGYLSDDEEYDDNGLTSEASGAKYMPPPQSNLGIYLAQVKTDILGKTGRGNQPKITDYCLLQVQKSLRVRIPKDDEEANGIIQAHRKERNRLNKKAKDAQKKADKAAAAAAAAAEREAANPTALP